MVNDRILRVDIFHSECFSVELREGTRQDNEPLKDHVLSLPRVPDCGGFVQVVLSD